MRIGAGDSGAIFQQKEQIYIFLNHFPNHLLKTFFEPKPTAEFLNLGSDTIIVTPQTRPKRYDRIWHVT